MLFAALTACSVGPRVLKGVWDDPSVRIHNNSDTEIRFWFMALQTKTEPSEPLYYVPGPERVLSPHESMLYDDRNHPLHVQLRSVVQRPLRPSEKRQLELRMQFAGADTVYRVLVPNSGIRDANYTITVGGSPASPVFIDTVGAAFRPLVYMADVDEGRVVPVSNAGG